MPGTASISSRVAATIRSGEPKWLISARLRAGPTPRKLVEDRARHRLVAAVAVEVDREAVGLVAHALEQMRGGESGGTSSGAERPGT